jgi:predicted nucleotidyltransferase
MGNQVKRTNNMSANVTKAIPSWVDDETKALVIDMITTLAERHQDLLAVILYGSIARHEERSLDDSNPSDVDMLAIFNSDDPLLEVSQGDELSHTLGIAYNRHLSVPREVQMLFASPSLREWDPTFASNVARDGIVLFLRGTLPQVLLSPFIIS